MSAAVCQESKTLEVAEEEEEEEKRIEGAEEENKGEREGGREAASKKVGLVTPASVASIVANIAFHARDRARINSHKYGACRSTNSKLVLQKVKGRQCKGRRPKNFDFLS